MTRGAVAAFGVAMFGMGAFVVTVAQERPRVEEGFWQEAVYLPVVPDVGQEIVFESGRCTVREVRREWIRCDAMPEWRNLYNGQRYSVLDPH